MKELWHIVIVGPEKPDIDRMKAEFLLIKKLKHMGCVIPERADALQQYMLESSKELRINLGFEKEEAVDWEKYC